MRRVERPSTIYDGMPARLRPPVYCEDWLTEEELAPAPHASSAWRDWWAHDAWQRWVDTVLAHLAAERGVPVIYGALVEILGDDIPHAQWRDGRHSPTPLGGEDPGPTSAA